jgi:MFS family permease
MGKPGDVLGLGLDRFLSDLGYEADTAILPLFLAALGAPPYALGAIETVSDGLSSFAKLFVGWLGDNVRSRRPWAAIGYAITGITTGLYGVATGWLDVLVARAIGWSGRGLRSPLHDTLLTETVPVEARGRAFGFDEAADTAGAIAGPLLALAVIGLLSKITTAIDSYRTIFWLAAIPGLLAAACVLCCSFEKNYMSAPQRLHFARRLRHFLHRLDAILQAFFIWNW